MKLIVVGDLHFRTSEPFYSAQKEFISWFHNQEYNNSENYFIQLGDTFHNSMPDPRTNALVLEFYQGLKFKKIYVLQGNHDFLGAKHQSALEILSELHKDIEIVDFVKNIQIENKKCLFLPYFYPSQFREKEIFNIYSFYKNLPKEFSQPEYDYLFSHIEDESMNFGTNNFVDLSYLNVKKRVSGHIHNSSSGYLGVPVLTRYDEKNHSGRILEVDLESNNEVYQEVPKFISYIDINYPDDLVFDLEVKYPIFSIKEIVQKDISESYYRNKYKDKNLYFRGFYKKQIDSEMDQTTKIQEEEISIKDHFNNFFIDNKIDSQVNELCSSYF